MSGTLSAVVDGRRITTRAGERRGLDKGPIDEALNPFGLEREIVMIVGGFSAALALARASDLIASVPERHTANLRGMLVKNPVSR